MPIHEELAAGRPYFIAEMGANHCNDLDLALRIVEADAGADANCLKVQTYTADMLTHGCDADAFIIKDGLWKVSRLYDPHKGASTPWECMSLSRLSARRWASASFPRRPRPLRLSLLSSQARYPENCLVHS